jgi:hypothetical protein
MDDSTRYIGMQKFAMGLLNSHTKKSPQPSNKYRAHDFVKWLHWIADIFHGFIEFSHKKSHNSYILPRKPVEEAVQVP